MAKTNVAQAPIYTHEGGKAKRINPEQELRRTLMACMLWEDNFYENGVSVADRLKELVPKVPGEKVAEMAIEARHKMKLRHAPLWIARWMAMYHKAQVADTLEEVIARADELAEFVSLYWLEGKQPLSKQVKLGLAKAFTKFDAYQLAKYNRDGKVKLRDVMFLCHPKPKDKKQAKTWKALADGTLSPPDTWEVALSSGEDKRESWERLMSENKLGGFALLRNLRNMKEVGVDEQLIFTALEKMSASRILPFRFIAAAQYAPQWEPQIEEALMRCLGDIEKLPGKTLLLVDVSGSMEWKISERSKLMRMDAACGIAIIAREMCEIASVYTFSHNLVQVPARRGFALRDAIVGSQPHGGTFLGGALNAITEEHDRIIVFTDEQAHDSVSDPKGMGYIINIDSYKNGVGYGAWMHIDGWSEAVLNYIREYEKA